MLGDKLNFERMLLRVKATRGSSIDEYIILSKHTVPSELFETIVESLSEIERVSIENEKNIDYIKRLVLKTELKVNELKLQLKEKMK